MRIISPKPHRTHTKAPPALLTSSLKQSSYFRPLTEAVHLSQKLLKVLRKSPRLSHASCFRSLSSRIWNFGVGSKIIATLTLVSVALVSFFVLATNTNAAPNYQMNYQGKLTNASNVAVADGTYNMRFWLLTTSSIATTSAVWTESLTGTNKVQVTNGLFSVMLGSTSPLTSVDFNQTLYLGVEIGGTSTAAWDGEMSPRKVLGTVPSAFEADRLDGLTSTQFVRTDATTTIASSSPETILTIIQNGVGDILNLFDGATEVFSVLDGGNIGIGSTTPSRKLTVQGGDAWFGGNLTATGTATFANLLATGSSTIGGGTGATGLTINGTATTTNLKITSLTAARALFTDANNLLTTSGVSQYLIDAITDETGTGSLVFSTNPLLAGFRSNASSTIGDGTATGGLTINGGATTTGNAYFGGNLTTLNNITAGSSTITFASSTVLTVSGNTFLANLRATGSSTIGGGTGVTGLTISGTATTTNLKITSLTASRALFTGADNILTTSGVSQNLIDSLSDETGTGSLVFSTNPLLAGFRSNASSTIGGGTGATGLTINGTATTTNLKITSLTAARALFTDANNLLTTTGLSQYLIDAITDETGTGSLVFSSNPLLAGFRSSASSTIGDGTGAGGLTINGTATTTNLKITALSDGCLSTVSGFVTSSGIACGSGSGGLSDWRLVTGGGAITPTSTVGIAVFASSTIGDGTGTGGLTIYGNSTTTLNQYVAGASMVGSRDAFITDGYEFSASGRSFFYDAGQHTDYDLAIEHSGGSSYSGTVNATIDKSNGIDETLAPYHAGVYGTQNGKNTYALLGIRRIEATWDSTPTALTTGTYLPGIGFAGPTDTTDGSGTVIGASLGAIVDGTVSAGFLPSALVFHTSTSSSAGLMERMRITSTGTIGIGTTTPSKLLTVAGDIFTPNNITAGSSTITFASSTGLTATNATFTGATTSSLYTTTLGLNSEYFTDLTGSGLQNTSNALTCITSNSSTFGCLTSADWSIFNNKVSSTSIDTSAELASLMTDETGSAGNLVFSGNPLLAGFRSSASSTIGDGTGTGGLTIYGNSTTTGNAYIVGTLSLGSTTPSARLTVAGTGNGDLFRFASSTGLSMLALDPRGVVNFGSTATSSIYLNGGPLTSAYDQNSNNIGIGNSTLLYLSPNLGLNEASNNIALGTLALSGSSTVLMTGTDNIAIGQSALSRNTTGGQNIALGVSALSNNDSGGDNIALGSNALSISRSSGKNIAIGLTALYQIVSGEDNVAVGSYAGSGAGSLTTDISYNTFLGASAGVGLVRGDKNIAIGYRADLASSTGSNQLNIGNLIYGTGLDGTFSTLSTGNIGIGSTTPSRKLTVNGDIHTYNNISAGSSTITFASSTALTVSGNTFLTNLLATGSSTIGGGTGATGLTINGTATTTNLKVTSLTAARALFTGADNLLTTSGVSQYLIDSLSDETGTGSLVFSTNPLLAGFRSSASSTIGGSTGATGLTIAGNSTTTLDAYFGGTLSLGSTSPSAKLTVVGTAGASDIFRFASSTGSNMFALNSRGVLLLGTQSALLFPNIYINSGPTTTTAYTSSLFGNIALGTNAFSYPSTTSQTSYNIALGSYALSGSSTLPMTGDSNIALGFGTLRNITTGSWNIGIGDSALTANTTGDQNVAVGISAGNALGSVVPSSNNTFIGYRAGNNQTMGDNNLALGFQVDLASTTGSNQLVIGNLIYGTGLDGTDSVLSSGNIGIGSTTPSRKLTVNGDIYGANITATGTATFANLLATGSSTIGGGTGATGLTINGTATTTNLKVTSLTAARALFTGADNLLTTSGVSQYLIDSLSDETGTGGLVFSTNPLLAGFRSSASSTIGDGTGAGGLTINGGATTTGNIFTSGTLRMANGTGNSYAARHDSFIFARSDFPTSFTNKITNSHSAVLGNTSMNFELTNAAGTGHVAALSLFGTGDALLGRYIGLGTTTPTAYLTIGSTTLSGAVVAGIKQHFGFVNSVADAVYYGNETYITNVPTATSTLVGSMIRIADTSTLGNTVRGFEAQAFRGTNTKGENTGLSGFGRTFGVRGTTLGDAGDTFIPAGVFAESQGTTQGNALRAYSGTLTSEELVSLFHDGSNFTGTGLQMNFGNAGGSFAATSSAKFVDFQVAGTSKFIVSANGSTTIGDGTVNAGLIIPRGGICVDNDGSCISTTTGQIRSVTSALGNSDLAEMYFSSQSLHAGEIVAISGGLSIKRAEEETEENIIGVVSTKPGLTLGFDDTSLIAGENAYPIGLKGRVPIKLSTENGPIKKGDRIALSSIPGVGMKATESSRVVGIALEDYDGTRAYTDGFLNQFGDDMYKEKVIATQTIDPRSQDGCSNGGGNALGEEACVAQKFMTEKAIAPKIDTTREDTLRAFARESALETTSANGEVAYVGQALMFIELTNYQIAGESRVLGELASSTLLENGAEGETIWSRIKTLAQNFVDGVLTVTGIKADRVEVKNELCVDGVCVTADDLRAILQNAHQAPQNTNTNTNTGDGEASVDPGTSSPPPSTEESGGSGGGAIEPTPDVTTSPEPTPEPEQVPDTTPEPEPAPPEPSPNPEPPEPEPTI